MILTIVWSEQFFQDFYKRAEWYLEEAGPTITHRFRIAVPDSLDRLAVNPTIGKRRRFNSKLLQNLCSFPGTNRFRTS